MAALRAEPKQDHLEVWPLTRAEKAQPERMVCIVHRYLASPTSSTSDTASRQREIQRGAGGEPSLVAQSGPIHHRLDWSINAEVLPDPPRPTDGECVASTSTEVAEGVQGVSPVGVHRVRRAVITVRIRLTRRVLYLIPLQEAAQCRVIGPHAHVEEPAALPLVDPGRGTGPASARRST